ncbi:ABC transporter substrate-binding protein [Azospirillum agricola]|uniref:ABC transporter substrate-binding protein n=1 Tax=Azospirillum agricola TaxID=1720247 RepID=UPI000A0F0699|nr:ABC transporter substrate-binding protein [Azospirillum agricola]SMH47149.1 NitT/TauT family transport system substrate-binding protein [Azospirillum lipoferum]
MPPIHSASSTAVNRETPSLPGRVRRALLAAVGAAVLLGSLAGPAAAEGTIRIAEQFGLGYLPLHVLRHQKLIEKHGKAQGIDVTVEWAQLSGGAAMNDALLSDSIDLGSAGVGPMLTIWDRTRGSANVKSIAALNSMPLFLTTTNPSVRTVKDFTDKDKIALPAVKVGVQARILQIATEQAFGEGRFDALDKLTVSLPHPDGTAALLSGSAEITGHISAPPFQYQQLQDPKIHRVFSSYDVLGGPHTFNLIWCKEAFRAKNPKTYKAFLDALKEAVAIINTNHEAAADAYLAQNKGDLDRAFVLTLLKDPDIQYTVAPQKIERFAAFMHKVGAIRNKPASWKDTFFEDLHSETGS